VEFGMVASSVSATVGQSAADAIYRLALEVTVAVGGVDTYYDYDDKQWKSLRLGGGPIRRGPVCPECILGA
jgi:hypothetical protein